MSSSVLGADNRIHFAIGRTYPSTVSLEIALPEIPKVQHYGECHVQAAIVAAEAACFRHTGKKLALSDAYLFNRHIRNEIMTADNAPFLAERRDRQFSQNDAGVYGATLERIMRNDVMSNTQYSMKQFKQAAKRGLQTRAQFWRLDQQGKKPIDIEFERRMRSELAADLDQSISNLSTASQTPDHPLHVCEFQKLRTLDFTLTTERAVALINNAIPFICQVRLGGINGQHVVLYAGYRFDTRYAKNVSFFVRDSRLSRRLDTGWAPYCIRTTVVYYPSEHDVVMKSISL